MRDKGWTAPGWPAAYGGGGLNPQQVRVLKQEMRASELQSTTLEFWAYDARDLHYCTTGRRNKSKNIFARSSMAKSGGVRDIANQVSGSDLASLQTSADDAGDHYIVNGQKVWTSYADKSDMIFCLVRTDKDAPKHKGISFY